MTVTQRYPSLSDSRPLVRATHPYYSDDIAQTCRMVAMLARQAEPIFAIEAAYTAGFQSTRHSHERGQISYTHGGMMSIVTDNRTLLLPAGCAIWIPPGVMHQVYAFGDICVFSAYVDPETWSGLPAECTVFQVSDIFEPLIKRVIARQVRREKRGEPVYSALLLLLHEELRTGRRLDVVMPMPRDRRLRRVCQALLHEPSIGRRKEELARIGNMSCRTMTRLFKSELAMTYSAWVQQVLVALAVARLAEGATVSSVAFDLGYCSSSAFTAMFRRQIAQRPSEFVVRR